MVFARVGISVFVSPPFLSFGGPESPLESWPVRMSYEFLTFSNSGPSQSFFFTSADNFDSSLTCKGINKRKLIHPSRSGYTVQSRVWRSRICWSLPVNWSCLYFIPVVTGIQSNSRNSRRLPRKSPIVFSASWWPRAWGRLLSWIISTRASCKFLNSAFRGLNSKILEDTKTQNLFWRKFQFDKNRREWIL